MRALVVFALFAGLFSQLPAALVNGDFEADWLGWQYESWWGSSAVEIAPDEGLDDSKALKLTFQGDRALMLQALAAFPGAYETSGWLKSAGVDTGDFRMAIEWFDQSNTWLGFVFVGAVSGTTDWTHYSTTVIAPPGTWLAKIWLYATEANHGTAWADAITFERVPAPANLLTNPGFESGMAGWDPNNSWYGVSSASVVDGEGYGGTRGLRIVGNNSRGVVLQVIPVTSGNYYLRGWVKCSDMGSTSAVISIDWENSSGGWVGNSFIGSISGTTDWTWLEGEVTAPADAARALVYAITPGINSGVAWFDDIFFARVPAPFSPAPTISASTQSSRESSLRVTWDPASLPEGTAMLQIYCEAGNLPADALPRVSVGAHLGNTTLWSLQNGQSYALAAEALDADGRRTGLGPVVHATVQDRQSPRVGDHRAEWTADGEVKISWTPHVLDSDVVRLRLQALGGTTQTLFNDQVGHLYAEDRPIFCTQPWFSITTAVPAGTTQIRFRTEDAAGNFSSQSTLSIGPAYPTTQATDFSLWTTAPTDQLRKDTVLPAELPDHFELTLARGQSKGFQVMVLPTAPLTGARVAFEPLIHANGHDSIDTSWLAAHFVNYVELTANAIFITGAERLWDAPAPFPDELSDDATRDLEPGVLQPIYIRVSTPRDAVPGVYHGLAWVETLSGRRPFEIMIEVEAAVMPKQSSYTVGQWIRWELLSSHFGVNHQSADSWRALSRLAEMLTAYRHSFVKVPVHMINSWRRPDGTVEHDFRDFDRFVDTHLAYNEQQFFAVSHMGGRAYQQWTCPIMRSGNHRVWLMDRAGDTWMDVVDVLPAIEAHVASRGLLDRFGVYVADEPIPENVASYSELASRVKAAAPALRRVDALLLNGTEMPDPIEIWVPLIDFYENNLANYQALQNEGHEVWFYIAWSPQGAYPNRMLDSMAIKSRVTHWLAGLYGATGFLHWGFNWWDIPLTFLDSPGDQYIVWRSQKFIVNSSLRFEAMLEGLEDWQQMLDLREAFVRQGMSPQAAQARVATMVSEVITAAQDYTRSWEDFESVRQQMFAELGQAQQPLRLKINVLPNGNIQLRWQGFQGVSYRIMGADTLGPGWADFQEIATVSGIDGENVWTHTPAGMPEFFYLLVD